MRAYSEMPSSTSSPTLRLCSTCSTPKAEDQFYWANKEHTRRRGQCIPCHLTIKAERWDNPDWVPTCLRCGSNAPRDGKGGRRLCEACHAQVYSHSEVRHNGAHRLLLLPCKGCGGVKDRGERLRYCRACAADRVGLTKGMRRFGLTVADYRAILRQQGNRCAICRAEPTPGRSFSIDHDHAIPGEGRNSVRGLLCNTCNYQRLSLFGDDPALLRKAAEYLESHPAQTVLT